MSARRLPAVLLLLLLAGCTLPTRPPVRNFTVAELWQEYRAYNGRRVAVTGFIRRVTHHSRDNTTEVVLGPYQDPGAMPPYVVLRARFHGRAPLPRTGSKVTVVGELAGKEEGGVAVLRVGAARLQAVAR